MDDRQYKRKGFPLISFMDKLCDEKTIPMRRVVANENTPYRADAYFLLDSHILVSVNDNTSIEWSIHPIEHPLGFYKINRFVLSGGALSNYDFEFDDSNLHIKFYGNNEAMKEALACFYSLYLYPQEDAIFKAVQQTILLASYRGWSPILMRQPLLVLPVSLSNEHIVMKSFMGNLAFNENDNNIPCTFDVQSITIKDAAPYFTGKEKELDEHRSYVSGNDIVIYPRGRIEREYISVNAALSPILRMNTKRLWDEVKPPYRVKWSKVSPVPAIFRKYEEKMHIDYQLIENMRAGIF